MRVVEEIGVERDPRSVQLRAVVVVGVDDGLDADIQQRKSSGRRGVVTVLREMGPPNDRTNEILGKVQARYGGLGDDGMIYIQGPPLPWVGWLPAG